MTKVSIVLRPMEDLDIRKKILKGAEDLFMKFGVRSISMDDIARHLSVSKKTLYHHFSDKEELVTLASESLLQDSKKQYETLTENAVDAIDELAKISTCLKKDMTEMNPSLLFDLQKYHPKAWEAWLNHKNNFIRESVARNVKQGIEEGYYRPEINPDIIASVRIEQIALGFDERIFSHDKFSVAQVQVQMFDHFVHGLCTEKGKKLYQKYKKVNQLSTSTIL